MPGAPPAVQRSSVFRQSIAAADGTVARRQSAAVQPGASRRQSSVTEGAAARRQSSMAAQAIPEDGSPDSGGSAGSRRASKVQRPIFDMRKLTGLVLWSHPEVV